MSTDSRLSLYHGSSEILTGPRFGYGNVHNDYGQGFYCTEYAEIAKAMNTTVEFLLVGQR